MPPWKLLGRPLAGALLCLSLAAPAAAVPVPETLLWDASTPGSDPAGSWASSVGSHDFNNIGAVHGATTSSYSGIDSAYAFDGLTTGMSAGSLAGTGGSQQNTSFELWFRPTDFSGGQQVLFETGGGVDGLSITLDDSTLLFRAKDNGSSVSLSFDLASDPFLVDPLEFVQIVASLDLGDTAELYVNGSSVASGSAAGVDDWAGGNGAGIGFANGRVGGTTGGDLDGYGGFDGEIALLRFYQDQILTAPEVDQNFDAVAATPEPGTGFLLGMGLMLLAMRRRQG